MTMTMAKIQVIGNIGKVEAKYSPDGKLICEFSIAHNYTVKGEKLVNWYTGAFWEKSAELFNGMVKAGTLVYVDGDLEVQSWTDKEGNNHSKLVLKPNTFRVCAKGKAKEGTPYDADPNE